MSTVPSPASTTEALGMLRAAMEFLNTANAAEMTAETQAQCLQALEQLNSMSTAARASILGAFVSGRGYSADADYSPRSWLIHRTRITKGAATAYAAWALFADPARRKHVVRAPAHLLSGIATCAKCGRGLHYRRHASDRADSYGCVKGPAGCGGTAIKAGLLEEYVTGAVLDALESPRVQQALRHGEDQHGPRRAELLAQITAAQDRRDEARRDYAGRVIDRADWLDIRQRTEDDISAARREYDRLAGSAAVMSDIPPSERVGEAWESWSSGRRRAAIRAVLHRVVIRPLPPGANANVAGNTKNTALRRERELAVLRQRVEFDWRV